MTTTVEEFHIEELDLEAHDWERGVDRIHLVRVRRLTAVLFAGPGLLQVAGFAVHPDAGIARELAEGEARAKHYKLLERQNMVPPLGPIRQPAGA